MEICVFQVAAVAILAVFSMVFISCFWACLQRSIEVQISLAFAAILLCMFYDICFSLSQVIIIFMIAMATALLRA